MLDALPNFGLFKLYESAPHIAEQAVASIMEKLKARYSDLGGRNG